MSKIYSRWTRDDKVKLLHGLKLYGYRDLRNIAKLVPGKSVGAIRTMIYRYSMLAKEALKEENPLDEWLQHSAMKDDGSMIPEALMYICLYEDHPPPSETGGIDVGTLYEMFYQASLNRELPDLSSKDIEALNNLNEITRSKISPATEAEVLEYLNSISESSTKVPEKVYSRKKG